jgi:formate dehydrogenase gamma subunit
MPFQRTYLLPVLVLAWAVTSFAANSANEVCVQCHGDTTLTRTLSSGAVESLTVTDDSLAGSRHESLTCVECHTELKGITDFPHPEHLRPVSCASCHAKEGTQVANGAHGGELDCSGCHGEHHILRPSDPRSSVSAANINRTCAACHDRLHAPLHSGAERYATYDVGLHGMHPRTQTGELPSCTTCHDSHTIYSEHKQPDRLQDACLGCHPQVAQQFRQSVHATINEGRANSLCFDCHGEHRSLAPSDTSLYVANESPAEKTCGTCHPETVAKYNQSLHAYALKRGNPRAPRCESCHGAHDIRPVSDPLSPMYRTRQPQTCALCHSKIAITPDPDIRLPRSFEDYEASTHGRLLAEGNTKVPICTDCHGGHAIRARGDAASTIYPLNIEITCGHCHTAQESNYHLSIHSRALRAGVEDAPTCTDCHGEHVVLAPSNPKSKVSHALVASETCGTCHNNPVIIRKYGLAPNVVQTYRDSYHGLATLEHNPRTPSCPDCHRAHDALTERDSLSTINPANVTQTCGKCHARADARFSRSYTHQALQPGKGGAMFIISRIYWVLLALIIGGMIVHNLVILNYYLIQAKHHQTEGRKIIRFDIHQLIQHMALTVSFTFLAITGFALKFPNAWWVRVLATLGLTDPIRRIIHRVMAVILIACALYHIIYLFFTRRGLEEWKSLLPRKQDVEDLAQTMKFYTRTSKQPPEYDRYDYSQKSEYWALIWGTLMMIATGLVLWFPAILSPILPKWGVAAAQTIHLYEAWLATLAIVVWHFFFTIFHPEEYPMSWTWLTGKINLEQVAHLHGRWYRRLTGKTPPPDPEQEEPEAEL